MFFPVLQKLSSKKIDERDFESADQLLYKIYSRKLHDHFNPLVYQFLDAQIEEDKWIAVLDFLSRRQLLRKNYELCCDICDETLKVYDNIDAVPLNEEQRCESTGQLFVVDDSDVVITYSFTESLVPVNEVARGETFFRA